MHKSSHTLVFCLLHQWILSGKVEKKNINKCQNIFPTDCRQAMGCVKVCPSLHPVPLSIHPYIIPSSIYSSRMILSHLRSDALQCSSVFYLKSRECSRRKASHLLYGQHPSVHQLGLVLLVFVLPLPAS